MERKKVEIKIRAWNVKKITETKKKGKRIKKYTKATGCVGQKRLRQSEHGQESD